MEGSGADAGSDTALTWPWPPPLLRRPACCDGIPLLLLLCLLRLQALHQLPFFEGIEGADDIFGLAHAAHRSGFGPPADGACAGGS
jgi:hypothetical protein